MIVINDASTDDTEDILGVMEEKYPHLYHPFVRSYPLYPNTIWVCGVKLRAISFSHWLLAGIQFVSVNTSQSCLLALMPNVRASFL